MNEIDRNLIYKLMDQLKHRNLVPELSLFDGNMQQVDIRLLGDLIIRAFPLPVGIEIRRLLSGTLRELQRGRLDQILKVAEALTEFLCFVSICEYVDTLNDSRPIFKKTVAEEFVKNLERPTFGKFASILRTITKSIEKVPEKLFVEELREIPSSNYLSTLDVMIELRNNVAHHHVTLDDESLEKTCVEMQELLLKLLEFTSFLAGYKLITIRNIQVIKNKRQSASFNHVIDFLNSSGLDFMSEEKSRSDYCDSNSVLLVQNIDVLDSYLNLSPFVIDTRTERIDSESKLMIKKDVFIFSGVVRDKLQYSGIESNEKYDLTAISSYPALKRELDYVLNLINPEQGEA